MLTSLNNITLSEPASLFWPLRALLLCHVLRHAFMTRPRQATTLLSQANLRRLIHIPRTRTSSGARAESWPVCVPWQSDSLRTVFQDCSIFGRHSAADAELDLHLFSHAIRCEPDSKLNPDDVEIEGSIKFCDSGCFSSTTAENTISSRHRAWILGERQRRQQYSATRFSAKNHHNYTQQTDGGHDSVHGGSWDSRSKNGHLQMLHRKAGYAVSPRAPVNFAALNLFGSSSIPRSPVTRTLDNFLFVRNYAAPVPTGRNKSEAPDEEPRRINRAISARTVRLVTAEGHAVISREEALERASAANLDLVEIDRSAQPPVCKLLDFSHMRYAERRKEKELKKKQLEKRRMDEVKEVRFTARTESKDLEMKVDMASKLLQKGHRVKLTVQFRASDQNRDLAAGLLISAVEQMGDVAKQEGVMRNESLRCWALLRPKPNILAAKTNQKKGEGKGGGSSKATKEEEEEEEEGEKEEEKEGERVGAAEAVGEAGVVGGIQTLVRGGDGGRRKEGAETAGVGVSRRDTVAVGGPRQESRDNRRDRRGGVEGDGGGWNMSQKNDVGRGEGHSQQSRGEDRGVGRGSESDSDPDLDSDSSSKLGGSERRLGGASGVVDRGSADVRLGRVGRSTSMNYVAPKRESDTSGEKKENVDP